MIAVRSRNRRSFALHLCPISLTPFREVTDRRFDSSALPHFLAWNARFVSFRQIGGFFYVSGSVSAAFAPAVTSGKKSPLTSSAV